jgi:hypothetical protein
MLKINHNSEGWRVKNRFSPSTLHQSSAFCFCFVYSPSQDQAANRCQRMSCQQQLPRPLRRTFSRDASAAALRVAPNRGRGANAAYATRRARPLCGLYTSLAKKYEFAKFCSYFFVHLHGWETKGNLCSAKYFGQKQHFLGLF